jgi:hypothetical protein
MSMDGINMVDRAIADGSTFLFMVHGHGVTEVLDREE